MAGDLAFPCIAAKLHDNVTDLSRTSGADRVSLRFETSARVNRYTAADRGTAGSGERPAIAFFHKAQIFAGDYFGDREAIVNFRDLDIGRAEAR